MKKEDWQNLHEILDNIYSDFLLDYQDFKYGKNKKTRDDASRKVKNSIKLATYWIKKQSESFS